MIHNKLAARIVQVHLNVSYIQLFLGQDFGEASYIPDTGSRTGSMRAHASKPCNFWNVLVAIKMILWLAQSKYPALMMADLMWTHNPSLQYA
jgi:hypothetical protein